MQRQVNTFLTLHSAPFTPCTSHFTCALRTRHFISPQITWALLSSSHLIPSLLTCHQSKFFSTVFISSEHLSTFLISSKFVSTHLSCSARQKPLTVREKSLAQKSLGAESFCTQTLETQMHLDRKAFPKYLWYKACTKHFPVLLLLVLKSLRKALPSTTWYYKACTKHFPALLCTTKLAQSTSQYYFALQGLHKALPSTTLHYKACTKSFPVLLCTTRLAQSTSQYYFVLQSLHKCTKHFPVPCTTRLAQSTSQYYFVLQSLQEVLPSTTLYYKACTKSFPVLLCTTKLAQVRRSTTLYYKPCTKYVPGLLCTTMLAQRKLWHTASSFAEKVSHTASFLNREAFTHSKGLHTEYFYTEKLLHTASVYTQNTFTQSAFTHGKRLHTQKLLHREAFTHNKLLDTKSFTHREASTQQAFTHQIFHTQQAFAEKSVYTKKLSCAESQQELQLQNRRISTPKRKKRRFWSTF